MCDIEDPLGRLVGMLVGSRCLRNLERFFISGVKEADMDDDDDDDATFTSRPRSKTSRRLRS